MGSMTQVCRFQRQGFRCLGGSDYHDRPRVGLKEYEEDIIAEELFPIQFEAEATHF